MTNGSDDDLHDRLMDWGLGERLGGEVPPDLRALVRARLGAAAVGPDAGEVPAPRRSSQRLLVAACVLLGLGAVFGVALWPKGEVGSPAAPLPMQEPRPALPDPVQVRSKADVDALPAGTRNVLAMDIEDDAMGAIARLRSLERLEITAEWAAPAARRDVPPVRSISDAGLRQLADHASLRILRLGGELDVKGPGLDVLARLPALEVLELELMKVGDEGLAHLAKAQRLHTVSLQYTQGFGPRTIAALLQVPMLREVSLQGCVHVEDSWLLQLAALPQLEVLDLNRVGSRTFFSGLSGPLTPAEPGSGVTDRVVEALGKATNLRSLYLSHAGVTGAGLRHLQGLPALRYADLSGLPVTTNDLRWLPPGIEWLTLRGCPRLDADFGRALAAATPRLRILDLQSNGFTDACLAGLRELRSLRNLDLSYCGEFTAAAIDGLTALDNLEQLTLRNWLWFGDAEWTRVRAMPKLVRLDTHLGSERLR